MKFAYTHLHLRSEDPDAAAKFYCDYLGTTVLSENALSTTKSILLGLDGKPVFTVSGRAQGEDPIPESTEPRYGLDHFGFEVDNMEGAIERFRAGGVHIICEPWTMPGGSKVAFVEAPDHVSVELIQSRAG